MLATGIGKCVEIGAAMPAVGMGCTVHVYSDLRPATVVRVSRSGKTCWIRYNRWRVGHGGHGTRHQDWIIDGTFTDEAEERCSLRKDGRWRTGDGLYMQLGVRKRYCDWEF